MNTTIKQIANDAKNRLKSGYWEELYKNREEDIKCAKAKGVTEDFVCGIYKTRHETAKRALLRSELYPTVYDIVVMEEDGKTVLNPIGRLLDHNVYDVLDEVGKQRYILELSRIYLELKNEVMNEIKLKRLKG